MPDTIIDTLTTVALNYGVPAVLVFWYACRVRHPARPRWRAFLMTLTVLAVVPPLVLGGLHYYITLRGGSVFVMVPALLSLPFVLRAIIRGWLRSTPAVPSCRVRHRPGRNRPGRVCHPKGRSEVSMCQVDRLTAPHVATPETRRLSGCFRLMGEVLSTIVRRKPESTRLFRFTIYNTVHIFLAGSPRF